MIYCAMPYVIEKVLPFEKSLKKDKLITDTGGELIRDRVVSASFEENTVSTETGAVYGYKELIIATGADPIVPPLPGTDLKGGNDLQDRTGPQCHQLPGRQWSQAGSRRRCRCNRGGIVPSPGQDEG